MPCCRYRDAIETKSSILPFHASIRVDAKAQKPLNQCGAGPSPQRQGQVSPGELLPGTYRSISVFGFTIFLTPALKKKKLLLLCGSDRCRMRPCETDAAAHRVPPGEGVRPHQVSPCWQIQETSLRRTNGIVCVEQCYTRAKKVTHATRIALPWLPRAKPGTATESSCLRGVGGG